MVIKHLELFSGIGGFRQAIDLLSHDFGIETMNIGFSEIDTDALETYKANYDVSKEIEIGDIVSYVSNANRLNKLPKFNLLTGGFPCQAFSMMGHQKGFKDLRGNVFFQIMEIIKNKQPDFLLLENVKNLMTHNKGKTFEIIIKSIKESGYKYVYYDVFNSKDFGLAQNRNRVFIFASRKKLDADFEFNSQKVLEAFKSIKQKTSLLKQKSVEDVLEKEVDKKYYLSDIIKPTILSDGSKNFKSKSEINQIIARPLTATMAKMHRACQDNYYSDTFIESEDKVEYLKSNFAKEELAKQNIRRLTPREAFRLQGFNDNFFDNALKAKISDSQLYKQAGNAVSVNTVYAILYYLTIDKKIIGG